MKSIVNWLHHLFNPHCPKCEFNSHCKMCNELQMLLEVELAKNHKLTDALITINQPPKVFQPDTLVEKTVEPIQSRIIPWHIRQAQLESQDAELASEMNLRNSVKIKVEQVAEKSIEELESELGLTSVSDLNVNANINQG